MEMEILVPFGVVVLAGLIQASMQLNLGTLLLLYHASLGKHIKRKTRHIVDTYITGVAVLVVLMLATLILTLERYFGGMLYVEEIVIVITMMVALAVLIWMFYYRSGRSTELWLPRSVAKFIDRRAKLTDSNVEAFSLGMLTSLAEMPFTLILLIVSANSILTLPPVQQLIAILLYAAITIVPLVVFRIAIRRGQSVVSIQRWRIKHKNFLRFLTGLGFIVLGFFIFTFEVIS